MKVDGVVVIVAVAVTTERGTIVGVMTATVAVTTSDETETVVVTTTESGTVNGTEIVAAVAKVAIGVGGVIAGVAIESVAVAARVTTAVAIVPRRLLSRL